MSEAVISVDPAILGDEDDALLARWLAPDGSEVDAGQPVAEVEAAKATVEVAAPRAGRLRHDAEAGAVVVAGQAIGAVIH